MIWYVFYHNKVANDGAPFVMPLIQGVTALLVSLGCQSVSEYLVGEDAGL